MNERCAICGEEDATTRDHIPPKGIFVKPRPNNLITVPACSKCNNGASGVDERFIANMGTHVSYGGGEGEKLFSQQVLRTLDHNCKLRREINETVKPVYVRKHNGQKVCKEYTAEWDKEAHIQILERTIRGLHYHHYGEILGKDAVVETYFFKSLTGELIEASKNWTHNSIGNDIFVYKYTKAEKGSSSASVWLFQFYGTHWAGGQTSRQLNIAR